MDIPPVGNKPIYPNHTSSNPSVHGVQEALNSLAGYDRVRPTGQLDGETQEELKRFQTIAQLDPSGAVTQKTIDALEKAVRERGDGIRPVLGRPDPHPSTGCKKNAVPPDNQAMYMLCKGAWNGTGLVIAAGATAGVTSVVAGAAAEGGAAGGAAAGAAAATGVSVGVATAAGKLAEKGIEYIFDNPWTEFGEAYCHDINKAEGWTCPDDDEASDSD